MQVADQVQERESEFTGLKGQLLRYAGCTYVTVIVSRFIDGLAPQAGCCPVRWTTWPPRSSGRRSWCTPPCSACRRWRASCARSARGAGRRASSSGSGAPAPAAGVPMSARYYRPPRACRRLRSSRASRTCGGPCCPSRPRGGGSRIAMCARVAALRTPPARAAGCRAGKKKRPRS